MKRVFSWCVGLLALATTLLAVPALAQPIADIVGGNAYSILHTLLIGSGITLAAFPNINDLAATTIEKRSKKIQDNVLKNNAGLAYIKDSGNVRPISGGTVIYEELSFAENTNTGWYSGYDLLPVAAQDVLSAAQFDIKQAAVPVVISGLDDLKNSGPEQMIDLMEQRMKVAESSMYNLMAAGFYSDGTGAGGKQIVGLDAMIPVVPNTGVYGGIDRAAWQFWRPKSSTAGAALTAATVQAAMNAKWAEMVRGMDRTNLIIMDSAFWQLYMSSLQAQQRFTSPGKANLGFPTIQFMDADVVLDGGIGGFATTKTSYWLNTKFVSYRPHSRRNMVPLNPSRRYAINQDAEVQILAWAGNITCSGAQFLGRLVTP